MLKERARFVAAGLRLVDMTMLGVAFPIAYSVRDHLLHVPTGGLYPISTYWPLLAASLLVWQLASLAMNVYDRYRTRGLATEIGRLARALALLAVIIGSAQFALKLNISRAFFFLYFVTAFLLLSGNRVAVRFAAYAARRRGYNTRAFAVVGSGEMSEKLVRAIAIHKEWGYTFEGLILDDEEGAVPEGTRALGRLSELALILERHVLDEIIFAVPRERLEVIERAVLLCDEQGVSVKILLDLFPAGTAKMSVEELDGMPLLAMTSVPSEMMPLVGKRIFDVLVSALALALLSPLFVVIALAIKLDSRGPVLFRQRRIGLHGRTFRLYKFRSMVKGAERLLPELRHRNEMDGPVFKIRDDPRVTRVGRWLRRTSMDELPQFWNVLVGDMSVVGPRPPIPGEVKQYESWQRKRLAVRPGITCTWQISGRNEVEFDRWMQLDLHYIENWSLWHDLKIVLLTIPAVLRGRGAR